MSLYYRLGHDKTLVKSAVRVEELKKRMISDVSKGVLTKKYQIRSLVEFGQLEEFCYETLGISLLYMYDENVTTSKVTQIIRPINCCCRECDGPSTFCHKKVPVKYCYFNTKTVNNMKSARNL
jgi:hypothetical protein